MRDVRKSSVLITGASGFLGTYLADVCVNAGYQIIGIDPRAPLRPQQWTRFIPAHCEISPIEDIMREENVGIVFHLAGGASVPQSMRDPFVDFMSLLPGTAALLAAMSKQKVQSHLVFFSSAAVYGNPRLLPISESSPIQPISPYGIHKATTEVLLQQYARAFSLSVSIVRIFSAYGPGLRKQLLWDVCRNALQAAANHQKEIILFGTGHESRDFIHARDIACAALLVGEHPNENEVNVINVASGTANSISEIATMLLSYLKVSVGVKFNGLVRAGDPLKWRADIRRLTEFGFRPSIDIRDGIAEVANWIECENSPTLR